MNKVKNWILTTLAKSDKLICVPEDWQKDYIKLAAEQVENGKTMQILIKEYNSLLRDYHSKCSIKELRELLSDCNVATNTTMSKEDLVNLATKEFGMSYEKK